MPLFEYRCTGCNREFELLVRAGETPTCPTCQSTSLEKRLSMFAVSSDGTQLRNRQTLGAQQRVTAQRTQHERTHEKHDHHDD